jgi:hypothetical protein
MYINNSELKSKIVWDGVVLQKGEKQEKVQLEGDKVEYTPIGSFSEGVLKGFVVLATGPAYPFLAGALKGYEGYTKTEKTAEKLGETDEWERTKAGLKGALVGGAKGFGHGILDYLVVGGLGAAAMALTAPCGSLLTPVIVLLTSVVSGFYNVAKDAIRR